MITLLPSREIALTIGSWSVHWYAVLYLAAAALVWQLAPRLQHWRKVHLSSSRWLELLTWLLAGAVIGGRLGYVLFYEPAYFAAHPAAIVALWQGGMSAHGGFLGVAVALWFARRQATPTALSWLALLDILVVPGALALALGRLGNWINNEIFMSSTAHAAAVGKDIVIAVVGYIALRQVRHPGAATAVFLVSYGLLRFASEYLRQQEFTGALGLTRGQLLTLPIIALGVWLWVWQTRQQPKP